MYCIVVTMYDDDIVKAMEAIKNYIKKTYDTPIKVYWIANILNYMPCIEEVRELETEYKYTIQLHELPIFEGMTSGHNIFTIVNSIKNNTKDKELKFIIGSHFENSYNSVMTGINCLEQGSND